MPIARGRRSYLIQLWLQGIFPETDLLRSCLRVVSEVPKARTCTLAQFTQYTRTLVLDGRSIKQNKAKRNERKMEKKKEKKKKKKKKGQEHEQKKKEKK